MAITYLIVYCIIGVTYLLADSEDVSAESNEKSIAPTLVPTLSPSVFCEEEDYFKDVLKEEHTQSFGSLIADQNAEKAKSFEASGVVYDSSRNVYWVVFDSLWSLAKITPELTPNTENVLVVSNMLDNNTAIWDESSFEGITWDATSDTFYLLSEAVEFADNEGEEVNHPLVRTATYDENVTYSEQRLCAVDFEAPTDNKGFEAINLIEIDGDKYFVGLCEGNNCSSSDEGRDSGHGRVVLFDFEPVDIIDAEYQYLMLAGIDCLYTTINIFELPGYINFTDYSAMQFKQIENNRYKLAVASQEDALVWIGEVEWSVAGGPDFDEYADDDDRKLYQLPKAGDCETIFCNIEGVAFTDNYNQLVMVSDKAKGGGDQPWICGSKDQSIHKFKYRN